MARLGTLLVVVGLCAIGYGLLWQIGLAPGSRISVPEPVALGRAGAGTREVAAPGTLAPLTPPTLATQPTHLALATSVATSGPTAASHPAVTPSARLAATSSLAPAPTATPIGGHAVRLAIPAIKVDTPVEQGGIVEDADGDRVWQTLPFVAVHYGDLTSLLGVPGNAVIAGHVVTQSQGNVFRFLYQLDLGDEIDVWDESAREYGFQVVDVKLVSPSDTSVMDSTPDQTLTLITCGGTFDPAKHEFSDRLIVTAKPR